MDTTVWPKVCLWMFTLDGSMYN